MSPELKTELKTATENLLYPSETDAEFELVELRPPYPWQAKDVAVESVEPRQFFAELREGPDGEGGAGAGFHLLYALLTGRLTDFRIHRVRTREGGRESAQVAIFLTGLEPAQGPAGQRPKQNRVGLRTHAVET